MVIMKQLEKELIKKVALEEKLEFLKELKPSDLFSRKYIIENIL